VYIHYMSSSNITNIAKCSFEKKKKGGSSSDYLTNKKSKIAYCNKNGCSREYNRVSSYSEKALIRNGEHLDLIAQNNGVDPDHKHDLINNLYSELDLNGVYVITDISGNELTNIDISLIPFYESYNIDINSSLFNNSMCNVNRYVKYMKSNLNYVPPTTILFNRT
jgi:hypothetical protein